MIALLQRVSHASVNVQGVQIARIDAGLLVFIGVQRFDGEAESEKLLEKVLNYRLFPDSSGRMNVSLRERRGGLLIVPQFTLAADTRSGTRAGFSTAAAAEQGMHLFDHFTELAAKRHPVTETGVFGAEMQVELVNDGPVTFWLEVRPPEPVNR